MHAIQANSNLLAIAPSTADTVTELISQRARLTADACAIAAPGRAPLTFAGLELQIAALAAVLNAGGIGRNDRVALVLPNGPEMAVAFLGVACSAICAPLNPELTADEFAFYLGELQARALIVQDGSDTLARKVARERGIPIIGLTFDLDASAGAFSVQDPGAPPAHGVTRPARADDVALVLHTSGTTGHPKQVLLTHANLCASARHIAATLHLSPADRCLNIMPLFHIHGLVAAVLASLHAGGSVACTPGLTGGRFLDWLEETHPTWYTAVPAMHQAILADADTNPAAIRSNPLRFIRSSSAPLPLPVMAALERCFSTPVIEAYGMTEAAHQISSNPLPPGQRKPGSVGLAAGPTVAIVNERGDALPCGERGEIVIRGANVSASACDDRESLSGTGTPGWFHTGDQGWLDPDGYLHITGRLKEMINRGGEKILPREIDAAIESHAGVLAAAAFGVPHPTLGEEIAAAVVRENGADVQEAHIIDRLRSQLGPLRVPRRIYFVDELPRTDSGKVRRSELPRFLGLEQGHALNEPVGRVIAPALFPLEAAVAGLWAAVLHSTGFDANDDFFLLGGDSLRGTRLLTSVAAVFGVELTIRQLFGEAATVAGMARAIENARTRNAPVLPATGTPAPAGRTIPARQERGAVVLSDTQRRMWFLARLDPQSVAYNQGCAFRLIGAIDLDALRRALSFVAGRHEVLRTTYSIFDDEPRQIVHDREATDVQLVDLSAASAAEEHESPERLLDRATQQPFDLEAGPVLRALVVRLGAQEHLLVLTVHHIAFDGWSSGILERELCVGYNAYVRGREPALPALPIQYADYALWQRQWMQGEVLESQLGYWKARLADLPTLVLPTDRPRPPVLSYRGERAVFDLPGPLAQGLKALGRGEGATLFMTLLAVFQVLLYRYSGQEDIAVGTPIAGRRHAELEGLIGFFANTLVLRADLSGNPRFCELLARVRESALGAYTHQDLPFEKLVEELALGRDMSRNPLFQVLFALQNAPGAELALEQVQVSRVPVAQRSAKFDLSLTVNDSPAGLHTSWEFSTDLYDAPTIERMARHFERLLEGVVADPQQRIAELPLLSGAERHQLLVQWNDTAVDYPADRCIHELFEAQAARAPHAVALVYEQQQLTYGELNARANQLAHHLIGLGVGPETLVAICMERSLEMIVGLLAILKAGAAYVPLDPEYPAERLNFMLRDAQTTVLLALSSLRPGLLPREGRTICLDTDAPSWSGRSTANPRSGARGCNAAYVIYTSGSTGRPKGVIVLHQNVCRLLAQTTRWFEFGEQDVWTLFHSFAFDFSVWEIWGALTFGGRLVIVPYETSRTPEEFCRLLRRERVTVLNQTPSAFRQLIAADEAESAPESTLRWVIFGGEALDFRMLRPWARKHGLQRPRLVNMFGITETTVHVTYHEISRADLDDARSLIGSPIPDLFLYLLDAMAQPVPIGVPGELYVGGAGPARGYLNRPELTAARFLPDPFSAAPDARMYRTGDLARRLPGGNIEYLGRIDHQVKIRGLRIELGEIEAALAEHAAVREVVVIAREEGPDDRRLVAYIVPAAATAVTPAALRTLLRERLPEYMVPSAYVILDRLPLTPNGKVDRQALPAPQHDRSALDTDLVAPRDSLEELVSGVWREVLNLEQVGVHDSFFDVGGHSLLAAQVVARLAQLLKVELPLRRVFEAPTVAGLAADLERRLGAGETGRAAPIAPVARTGSLQLSFAQLRLWLLDRLQPGNAAYNVRAILRLLGTLDLRALERSIHELVTRHEALRTRFALDEGQPTQIIDPPQAVPMPVTDLSAMPRTEREASARQIAEAEAAEPFDLEAGPVLRALVVRLGAQEHLLVLTVHHIAFDGWSSGILERELCVGYNAYVRGREPALPALPIQYADYALWQRQWMQGEVLESQLGYWKARLADLPTLVLPTDRPRPPVLSYRGERAVFDLPGPLAQGLKALGRGEGATLFMTLLAVFQVLLYRYSGQEDIAVGTPIAGRRHAELEGLIGFFANTLVLRADLSGNPRFCELLARVRESALGAYTHQDLPFEKLVEELALGRDMSRNPLFQVLFALQNAPGAELALEQVQVSRVPVAQRSAKFDLSLTVNDSPAGLHTSWEFSTDLYDAPTIERMARHFERLLEGVVADPQQRIAELPLLSGAERHQLLVQWNDTAVDYPADRCIHELFEAQAARAPHAVALVYEQQQLTYGELNARANQLAHHLIGLGVGPETLVAICMERSLEMIVGLLAILKAGAAYVPLDPEYPAERWLSCWTTQPPWCSLPRQAYPAACRATRGTSDASTGTGPISASTAAPTRRRVSRPKRRPMSCIRRAPPVRPRASWRPIEAWCGWSRAPTTFRWNRTIRSCIWPRCHSTPRRSSCGAHS
jgi:amino acid adenylation domain-containing protein